MEQRRQQADNIRRPKRRVLVVDDNRDAADALAGILTLEGHEVRVVYSAAAAIDAALELHPDLVLLDIGLPQMDGYELARRLRQMPELKATGLVAVTGYGQPRDRERSRELGFDYHMVKPVDLDQLNTILTAPRAQA